MRVLRQVPGFGCAARLSDLGIYRVISELLDSQAMRDLAEQTLGPIHRYDGEMGGDLLHTLQIYFQQGCNLRRTAEAMFLHKNSISYRLRKIEELTERSLGDAQFALELQLCLKYSLLTSCFDETI